MFIIGSRRLKKSFYEYCIEKNKFYLASDSAGAKSSQPSLLHVSNNINEIFMYYTHFY